MNLDFGTALMHLKAGRAVARSKWGDAVMILVPPMTMTVGGPPLSNFFGEKSAIPLLPHFGLKVQNVVMSFRPSDQDILADDWQVALVEPPASEPATTDSMPAPKKRRARK